MKISREKLKQLVEKELKSTLYEQQSEEDLERQGDETSTANIAAAREKYGADPTDYGGGATSAMAQTQIDLLTEIRDILNQLLTNAGSIT